MSRARAESFFEVDFFGVDFKSYSQNTLGANKTHI